MPHTSPPRLTIVAVLAFAFPSGISAAHAQDATPWDTQLHAAARLLAGSLAKSGGAAFMRAGIEIRLDPGWKTYWRDPGDSGVPPTLDFSGSENIKSVTVLWPAPQRFPDGAGGSSIGYVGDVVLPLRVIPEDAAKAAAVRLKLGYAVCGNVCVPVESSLHLALPGNGAEEKMIETAEAQVPQRLALGAGKDLVIRSVHRQSGDGHDRVLVEVAAPAGAPVELFVEGPTPEWSLPLPEPTDASGAVRHFAFDL